MTLLGMLSLAWAAPEVAVVGVHVAGLQAADAEKAADALGAALEASKVEVSTPADVSEALKGKEQLVLEDYSLVPGRELVQEARILYDRAQPADAIPVLQEGVAALERALGVAGSPRDLQDALLLLALCHLANGEESAARETFAQAAVLDPSRELENASYSPEARQLFDTARKGLATQAPGRLWVMSSADATVLVDGREIGSSPIQDFALVPGHHVVVARGPHGSSVARNVTVETGKTTRVDAMLERRNLGVGDQQPTGRSRQIKSLYQSLGRYSGSDLVLVAGVTDGTAMLQLYDPQAGNFSKIVKLKVDGDPVETMVGLVPSLVDYIDPSGNIKAEKVSPLVVSLDVGTNDLLAGLLLDPVHPEPEGPGPTVAKPVPWYVWAGVGAVVVGGGAAGLAVALTPEEAAPSTGIIRFGPIP